LSIVSNHLRIFWKIPVADMAVMTGVSGAEVALKHSQVVDFQVVPAIGDDACFHAIYAFF
jgi:hypothetical protein